MKQEKIFTTTQVESLLEAEFKKFHKQWHGVANLAELQTLAKFIEQVKDEINKVGTNPC